MIGGRWRRLYDYGKLRATLVCGHDGEEGECTLGDSFLFLSCDSGFAALGTKILIVLLSLDTL